MFQQREVSEEGWYLVESNWEHSSHMWCIIMRQLYITVLTTVSHLTKHLFRWETGIVLTRDWGEIITRQRCRNQSSTTSMVHHSELLNSWYFYWPVGWLCIMISNRNKNLLLRKIFFDFFKCFLHDFNLKRMTTFVDGHKDRRWSNMFRLFKRLLWVLENVKSYLTKNKW